MVGAGAAPITAAHKNAVDQTVLFAEVARVEVHKNALAVWLNTAGENHHDEDQVREADQPVAVDRAPSLLIPWTKPPPKRFKEILSVIQKGGTVDSNVGKQKRTFANVITVSEKCQPKEKTPPEPSNGAK